MSTLVVARPPVRLDPAERQRAIAFATKLVRRYEAELQAPITTEASVAHHAIVQGELDDWRHRLDRLQASA